MYSLSHDIVFSVYEITMGPGVNAVHWDRVVPETILSLFHSVFKAQIATNTT